MAKDFHACVSRLFSLLIGKENTGTFFTWKESTCEVWADSDTLKIDNTPILTLLLTGRIQLHDHDKQHFHSPPLEVYAVLWRSFRLLSLGPHQLWHGQRGWGRHHGGCDQVRSLDTNPDVRCQYAARHGSQASRHDRVELGHRQTLEKRPDQQGSFRL